MTISTTASRISYNGNGVTTVFSFPYRFLANGDIVVIEVSAMGVETIKALTTHYTLTGAGDDAGGSVTMIVAPASGTRLIIYRDTDIVQETDYISGDPFPAETHERALDRLTMIAQEVGSDADRAIKVPVGDSSSLSTTLPAAANRLDRYIAFDATTGEMELSTHTQTQVASAIAAAYAAGSTADAVTFLQDGSGATSRSVQDRLRDVIHVTDFGTLTGTNDNTTVAAAFVAGAGKHIHFPAGTYAINDLTWPANTMFTGDGVGTVIKKRANGDLGTLGAMSVVKDIYFDLNGTNVTGRGFVVSTGAVDFESWREWHNCQFIDSYSYAIEFTQDMAGYQSYGNNCRFTMSLAGATPYATPAIKLPTVDETNGNRHFHNCNSGGFILIDFAGGENTNLTNCLMAPPLFSASTQKAVIVGGRMVNRSDSSAWTITGSEIIIVGNSCAQLLVTLDAALDEAFIDANSWAATTFTDNSTGDTADNKIYLPSRVSATPGWTGSVSDPVIGNGQLFGSHARRGEDCRARITLAIGSTTTLGSGYFKFTLPYAPADVVTGTAVLIDASTGTPYALGVLCPTAGTNELRVVVGGTGYMTGASPVALVSGDVLYIDIDYRIK